VRQHDGETPAETSMAVHWKAGLENVPDVAIETTGSGSMIIFKRGKGVYGDWLCRSPERTLTLPTQYCICRKIKILLNC